MTLDEGLSTGLFCDQRDNRALVRDLSRGARVLNLFSYTCSFTVAAGLGGAVETVSVDLSGRALERGEGNLALNGLGGPAHRLLRADALSFLARQVRGKAQFDCVILDPPSFGTRSRGTFSVERDYPSLLEQSLAVLRKGGRLLAVTNHRKTSPARFLAMIREAARARAREIATVRELPMPADYPHRPGGELPTKSALVTLV